jgi:preprotein translocase subunit SecG
MAASGTGPDDSERIGKNRAENMQENAGSGCQIASDTTNLLRDPDRFALKLQGWGLRRPVASHKKPPTRGPDPVRVKDPPMENVILVVHLILAICLIGVVLLQRSEGGGLGMGGGGGVMTGRQAATALGKLTWAFAIAFLATSITLTIIAAQNSAGESVLDRIGVETAPEDGGDGALLPPAASDLLPPASGDAPVLPPRADE